MGDRDELIGLYWTTSGPVEVHVGREWSLFDLRDRCEQAARVGFSGIGLWHADLEHVLETRTLREVRQLFDDNGLRHLELEFLGVTVDENVANCMAPALCNVRTPRFRNGQTIVDHTYVVMTPGGE